MNNIYKILSAFIFCVVLAACSKSNNTDPVPIRDYATQYAADKDTIDKYLNTHYMTVDPTTFDVTFTKIAPGGAQQSIKTQTQYPLLDTIVVQDGINYHIPFIKFREGDIINGKRPTQVDSIHVAYKGVTMTDHKTSELNYNEIDFDAAVNPVWFKLQDVISGWTHILTNFHTGTYTTNPTTFVNYGAGVMFLPSGLAYYNNATSNIGAYSPLIFTFKLCEVHYRDHDGDGILSKDERKLDPSVSPLLRWKENPASGYDYNGDGVIDSTEMYDTDGDGIPNMYDTDDDGDHILTRVETVKDPADITPTAVLGHYPFDPTPTEPKGVPARTGTVGNYIYDYTTKNRLRKYLDPSW